MKGFGNKAGLLACALLGCFLFSNNSFCQPDSAYTAAKIKLLRVLKQNYADKAFLESIDRFYSRTCDSLIRKKFTVDDRPIKIILTRLFDASETKINDRSITPLRIPSVNSYFLLTIKSYKKLPLKNLFREIGTVQSAILASAFDGLPYGDSIATFAGLREMRNIPYFISTRLQQPRYAPYRDSLLYYLANTNPKILAKKLADNDSLFTALVQHSNNVTVKAITQIKQDDDLYDKILPFGLALMENRITVEEIKKLTLTPPDYYKAFTDEVIRLYTDPLAETRNFLEQPIIELNKTLADKYFISDINVLHESPEKTRFQILNNLNTRELYFILIGGSGELYTSSFLYVYKKFLKESEKEGLDKFFDSVGYYQFTQFIFNISGYGLVNDLLTHMQEEKFASLVGNDLTGFQDPQLNDNQVILDAMTISEVLYEIKDHPAVNNMLLTQLENLEKPKIQNDIMLQRMYRGLKDILQNKNNYNSDNTYDVLAIKRMQNQNGIVQVHFFYDDEDATASFNNSIATYTAENWEKKDMGNYIVFNSRHGNKMMVYMNKPMTKPGYDSAQDEMLRAINHEGYEPTSFIHRGHSYYLAQSLKKMTPFCQFVFLGSCGGYNEVLKVFQLNPDVNIIATRNIGSMLINDPLLIKINMDIVNNKDIRWAELWQELDSGFQSKLTKDLFSSYISPDKYIGIKFIRKVFNF